MTDSVSATGGRAYCSQLARSAGARLIGTADPVDLWLLLEYNGTWRNKALVDNGLPPAAQAWLRSAGKAIESATGLRTRTLFIRQPSRGDGPPLLLLVRSGEQQRFTRRVQLPDHAALAEVDPVALAAGTANAELVDVPLYLVCTNGQRDLCCARFGLPVFDALAERFGGSVWQTTHIGGHRFAPNLVCLPEGLVYGFADPERAIDLVAATRRGEVVAEHLRGRSCYSPIAQVADLAVRQRTQQLFLEAVRLAAEQRVSAGRWRVGFDVAGQGRVQVTVCEDEPQRVQASCGDDGLKETPVYRLEE